MRVKRAPPLSTFSPISRSFCVLQDQLMDKIIRTNARFITFENYEHRTTIIIDNTNRNRQLDPFPHSSIHYVDPSRTKNSQNQPRILIRYHATMKYSKNVFKKHEQPFAQTPRLSKSISRS